MKMKNLKWRMLGVMGATISLFAGFACGGATVEHMQQSDAQFRLAATVHQEGGNRAVVIRHLRNSLELDDTNPRAHLLMGFVLIERRNWRAGLPSLERAVQLMEELGGSSAALAEARNVLGSALIQAGRSSDAVPILEASAGDLMNTTPHLALGNLGLAYYEMEQYGDARVALRDAVEQQQRFCLGYYRLGMVLFAQEEFELAERALTHAVDADPSCTGFQDAYKLRGEVYARLELSTEAVSDMERCMELGPRTVTGQFCERFLEGIR